MKRETLEYVLGMGFIAVALGIFVAWQSPASTYEVSIYTETPILTWAFFAIAFAVAVSGSVACRGRHQAIAIALGGLSTTAVVSLPVIRSYRFLGMGDALTHLGWFRDFISGEMHPHELFYPGLHSIATVFHYLSGVPLERTLMLVVVFLFVPFVVFVPLVVRDLTGNTVATGFGAILAWFVLPINNIATHMSAHTNSNALFLVPVVLFAFVAFLQRRPGHDRLPLGISPFTVVLYLTAIGLLLVHPQQMINVVVLLGTIGVVQWLARGRYDDHPVLDQPLVMGHAIVLGAMFVFWAAANERFRRAFSGLVYGVMTRDIGTGAEVDQRESSLAAIGGSLPELFAKMFLVSAIIGMIVVLFVLLVWFGRTSLDRDGSTLVTYLALSLFPLGGMFVIYFVGTPTMAFRQVGFIYVLLTILGAVALAHGFGWLSGPFTKPGANTLAVLFVGACLVLSLMTVFGSPYIYNASQHVTDQQMSGMESTIEHRNDDTLMAGFGLGTYRYGDAVNGVEGAPEGTTYEGPWGGTVTVDQFEGGNYAEAYHGNDYYFIVTSFDETREFEIYGELHHTAESLQGIEYDSNTNKVVANEEYRLYTVNSDQR